MPSFPEQSVVAYVVGVRLGQLESLRTTWESPVARSAQRLPSLIRVHLVHEFLPQLQLLINAVPQNATELGHQNILELTRGIDQDLAAIQVHSAAHEWNDENETSVFVDVSVRNSVVSLRGHLAALKRNIRELLVGHGSPQSAELHWLDLGWEICRAGSIPLDDYDQEERASLPEWAHDHDKLYSWSTLDLRTLGDFAGIALEEIIPPLEDEASDIPVAVRLAEFMTGRVPRSLWYRVEAGIAWLQRHEEPTPGISSGVGPSQSSSEFEQTEKLRSDEEQYGYLGLAVDETRRLVRRKGYDEAVDFSKHSLPWAVFIKLVHSRETAIDDVALFPLWDDFGVTEFPGPRHVSDVTQKIGKLLKPLEVNVKKHRKGGCYLNDLASN